MGPYFFLELKIYGQWLSGGKRRLCKVANPSSHLSVVANFVGAILASKVGWKEASKFLWAALHITLWCSSHCIRDFQQANHWLRSSIPCPLCSLLPHLLQALLGKLYMVIFMGCQGRTYQLFHRVRVFSGMVVLYLPHDNSIRDNNQVRRECPWSSKQGTCT